MPGGAPYAKYFPAMAWRLALLCNLSLAYAKRLASSARHAVDGARMRAVCRLSFSCDSSARRAASSALLSFLHAMHQLLYHTQLVQIALWRKFLFTVILRLCLACYPPFKQADNFSEPRRKRDLNFDFVLVA